MKNHELNKLAAVLGILAIIAVFIYALSEATALHKKAESPKLPLHDSRLPSYEPPPGIVFE
jgi:hypothetical protein